MDEKLKNQIRKHEFEYLKGYSIYVRQKERELKELVVRLNNQDLDSKLKDEIVFGLKQQLKARIEETIKIEKSEISLKAKVKQLLEEKQEIQKDFEFMK
jgi:hypothetical protein